MKKILLMFALMVSVLSANSQIATENSKVFDNVGVGVTSGLSTPLDFNSVFPLNTNVGLKVTKDVTPILGFQVEGLAFLNDNHFSDIKTSVKATNVGLNGTVNLFNLFGGYRGTPRVFEVSTVTGLGWLHTWNTSLNNLTAKTGLDLSFNLGKKKAHSLVLTPTVYWNLNKVNAIQFNKNASQLALNVSYVYHFKTSNGTHSFKTYDVGAMKSEIDNLNGTINSLNQKLSEANKVSEVVPTNAVATVETKTVNVVVQSQWFVQFAQNSSELTDDAKAVLDNVTNGITVNVVGTASPEGTAEYNTLLSEKRAAVVADYLRNNRGVTVNSTVGKGVVNGASSNRLAIVTTVQ